MCAMTQSKSEHQGGAELLRIPIPRTWVNKDKAGILGRTPAPCGSTSVYERFWFTALRHTCPDATTRGGVGFLALGAGAMRHSCADRPRPPSGPRELRAAILLPVAFEPLFEGWPVGVVFALKALSVGHGSAFKGHSVDQLLLSPASGLAQVSIA